MVETLSLHTLQLPRGSIVEPVLVQVVVVAAPHVHLSAISIALACLETFVVVAAKHDGLEKWCCATNDLSAPLTIWVFTTVIAKLLIMVHTGCFTLIKVEMNG